MSEPVQTTGEIIAAHPSRVAQADQVQAARPRKEPSKVMLSDLMPTDRVYIFDIDAICALPDWTLPEMKRRWPRGFLR